MISKIGLDAKFYHLGIDMIIYQTYYVCLAFDFFIRYGFNLLIPKKIIGRTKTAKKTDELLHKAQAGLQQN